MDPQNPGTPPAAPAAPVAPPANPAAPAAAPAQPSAPAAAPAATTESPAPAAQPAHAGDPTIPLPKSLYEELIQAKAALGTFLQTQREKEAAAQQEQARLLAQKGELDNALKLLHEQKEKDLAAERAQRAAVEERAKRYALDGEVSRELAAYDFASPKLREMFLAEVRSELVVEAQGDTFVVRTPTFQPAAAAIAAKLSHQDYQVFLRPKGNPGGGTQPNAAAPTPVNPAAQQQPIPEPAQPQQVKTGGQLIIDYYKAERAKLAGSPAAGYAPNRPIGLGPLA